MTLTHFKDDERKANPRAAMVRVEIRDAQGYANQRRHDLRIGAQPAYVNPDPPEPNRVFIQPMTTQEIKALARERRAQRDMARAMKSNSGVAVVGIIGFGIEAQKMFEDPWSGRPGKGPARGRGARGCRSEDHGDRVGPASR